MVYPGINLPLWDEPWDPLKTSSTCAMKPPLSRNSGDHGLADGRLGLHESSSRGCSLAETPAWSFSHCFCCDTWPGELTFCHGTSPFLMGKSTISMAIFHCYVSIPEGTPKEWDFPTETRCFLYRNQSRNLSFICLNGFGCGVSAMEEQTAGV